MSLFWLPKPRIDAENSANKVSLNKSCILRPPRQRTGAISHALSRQFCQRGDITIAGKHVIVDEDVLIVWQRDDGVVTYYEKSL